MLKSFHREGNPIIANGGMSVMDTKVPRRRYICISPQGYYAHLPSRGCEREQEREREKEAEPLNSVINHIFGTRSVTHSCTHSSCSSFNTTDPCEEEKKTADPEPGTPDSTNPCEKQQEREGKREYERVCAREAGMLQGSPGVL